MKQPSIHIPSHIEIPRSEQFTTTNGVKIYTIPTEGFEVVRVSFVFHAGSSWQSVPFSASAVANCLAEGTRNMTAQEIAEKLDFYGSFYDVSIDRDWASVTFVSLASHFMETIRLAEDILLHPVFPEDEIKTWCDKSRVTLTLNRRKGDYLAREAFLKAIYGENHPYGRSYNEALYNNLTPSDLTTFYKKRYTASECFVVASGAIDDNIKQNIAHIAEQLPTREEKVVRTFSALPSSTRIDVPLEGAVQASLRIGKVLFGRSHPDFTAMQLLLSVLGGYFGSRLMKALREERGYTYGVYTGMINLDAAGHLAISTEVGSEVAEDAIDLIFNEMERLKNEPITEKELSLTKRMVLGETMRILDGPFGIADITIENTQCGLDNEHLARFLDEIRSIDAQQLQALAVKYLNDMTTIVVR